MSSPAPLPTVETDWPYRQLQEALREIERLKEQLLELEWRTGGVFKVRS